MKNFIFVLFHPSFWGRGYPTSVSWSNWLEEQMNRNKKVKRKSQCIIEIGGEDVWVANYPYAYGSHREDLTNALPRAITAKRLMNYVSNPANHKKE